MMKRIGELNAEIKLRKAELTDCKAEADRFKAEVERLRKAGDAMAFHYQELVRIEWGNMTTHIAPSIVRWTAAKEGKPPA
jgi:hypothetical protein